MTVFDMLCRSMWRRHTYLEYQVMICLAGVTDRQTDSRMDRHLSTAVSGVGLWRRKAQLE